MIEKSHLEHLAKRQKEINIMQASLNDEFGKYRKELFEKAREVLQWKDDNLGQKFLKYKCWGYIHELRNNSLVLCFPDVDSELPIKYYKVPFDELYSDNWKQVALEEREKKIQQDLKEEKEAKEKAMLEYEKMERAEYERLKAKFE